MKERKIDTSTCGKSDAVEREKLYPKMRPIKELVFLISSAYGYVHTCITSLLAADESLIINNMQILPLLSLLPLRCRRQIIKATPPIILQIMISQILQVRALDPQIGQRLGVPINDLVQHLLLNLIRTDAGNMPPKELVEVVGQGLEEAFGHVDVAALVDDFLVDEGGDFFHTVGYGTVEFEGLGGGGIVHGDFVEGFAYVNHLED
jgi:hypothetical protein